MHSYGLNTKFKMNVTDIHNIINLSLPVAKHNYKGNQNVCGMKYGFGKETWDQKWHQKYQGLFYKNCLHTLGTYEWNYNKEKYIYDGKIYANDLEGYGMISYPDGSTFEGLFRRNQRYGPGVYSYPDGTQDVGLWNGLNLVRLSSRIDKNSVPCLAKSMQGKIYLAQYRKLISFTPKPVTHTDKILQQLKASDKVQKERSKLCNSFIKNTKSLFFDTENFDSIYFSDENQTVDVLMSFDNGIPLLQKKVVSDIIAWNNEEDSISMMKHVFLHRHYENNISFNINSILVGVREDFEEEGALENTCKEFLTSCTNGDQRKIIQLITDHDLNPDITDLEGNTGIHCASSNDHLPAIKALVNYGANVDIVNDEGLTPLGLSILRCIAIEEQVEDWEKAFLPGTSYEEKNDQWRSKLSFDVDASHKGSITDQLYILNIECKHPIVLKKKKHRDKSPKSQKSVKSKSSSKRHRSKSKKKTKKNLEPQEPTPEQIQADLDNAIKQQKLNDIRKTIVLLLYYGADPNLGEVPLPPLILSIFSKDEILVEELIKYGADCNITTSPKDGSLTALHIITALKPTVESVNIATTLLKHGANPNSRANSEHWLEEKQLIDPIDLCEDEGKTPLHLLSMRQDFLEDPDHLLGDLYENLVNNGCDPNLYYLGHTCLSLALIRGNISLMNKILGTYEVDPNQFLGCNMGVPLTVPILKRYKGFLPVPTCKDIYAVLNNFNANPFNLLPNFIGNCIEFCEKDNEGEDKKKKEKKKTKLTNVPIINLLKNYGHDFLNRNIQAKVIRCIYEYKIKCGFSDNIFDAMVPFVNSDDALRILNILLNHKIINYEPIAFYSLIEYVQKMTKSKAKSKNASQKLQHIVEIIQKMVPEKVPIYTINAPLPEIDPDEEKYHVCFNCLKKTNKVLVLCPNCQVVYFCSEHCNKINLKHKTHHKCKGVFYANELKRKLAREKHGSELLTTIDKFKKYGAGFLAGSTKALFSKGKRSKSKHKKGGRSKERESSLDSEGDIKGKKKKKKKHKDGDDSSHEGKSKKPGRSRKTKTHGLKRDKSKGSKGRSRDTSRGTSKSKRSQKESGRSRRDKSKTGRLKGAKGRGKSKGSSRTKTSKGTSKHSSRGTSRGTSKRGKKESGRSRRDKSQRIKSTKGRDKSKGSSRKQALKGRGKSRDVSREQRSTTPSNKYGLDKDKDLYKDALKTKSQALLDDKQKGDFEAGKPDSQKGRLGEITRGETLGDKMNLLESDASGLLLVFNLNKMLLPCCVLINGQLYYKFGAGNTFCGLTYSNV